MHRIGADACQREADQRTNDGEGDGYERLVPQVHHVETSYQVSLARPY